MNKIINRFKYVKILINTAYSIFYGMLILFILKRMPDQLFELDFTQFILVYLCFILILSIFSYIMYFISIIWHEIGHLIFGLKAKLTFVSFNVLSYTIRKENNRLKIKKEANIPGIAGYCNMTTIENKKYKKIQ